VTEVEDLLQKVTDLVAHLRWRVGPPQDGELNSATLAKDPDYLAASIANTSQGRGSDDPQVLGSLWWQAYAYRVAGTTAACWVLGGAAPDPSIEAGTAVGIARSRPSSVVYGPDSQPLTNQRVLLERLFEDHLDLVAKTLRERHALGEQLIWGNAAAGIASALSAVGTAPKAPALQKRTSRLMEALPHGIKELGRWPADWSYRRRTCCLWWKTTVAGGNVCEDCSLR
jgi:ferric iron reductase protein FhuF